MLADKPLSRHLLLNTDCRQMCSRTGTLILAFGIAPKHGLGWVVHLRLIRYSSRCQDNLPVFVSWGLRKNGIAQG